MEPGKSKEGCCASGDVLGRVLSLCSWHDFELLVKRLSGVSLGQTGANSPPSTVASSAHALG